MRVGQARTSRSLCPYNAEVEDLTKGRILLVIVRKEGALLLKGNQELVDALNGLLASELTSINQYMVHAEMAEDWSYTRLSENFKKRSITEMKHAERLIERILFLEGTPIVSHLNDMHIGAEIPQQVNNDHALELDAIRQYNEAIVLAGQVLDYATRDILEAILRDEDTHLDELEELQDQIEQMTLPTFLSTQN